MCVQLLKPLKKVQYQGGPNQNLGRLGKTKTKDLSNILLANEIQKAEVPTTPSNYPKKPMRGQTISELVPLPLYMKNMKQNGFQGL